MSNTNFELLEYFNQSDANKIITEASEKLMKCITDDVSAKLNVLKVQNIELQECIKKQSEELKKYMKRECDLIERERSVNNLEKNFATKKLKDITSHITESVYGITYKTIDQPKCNLCDAHRIITLKDANNNEYKVKCKCSSKSITVWCPIKKNIMKIGIRKSRYEKDIEMKFYYFSEDDGDSGDTYAFYTKKEPLKKLPDNLADLYNIPYSDLVFFTEELAQECCDYLNRNIDKEILNQAKENPDE